tara:strand:- start:11990 stop:12655 length:666 start_codon:yes stop_codon:yes gene_type:complete
MALARLSVLKEHLNISTTSLDNTLKNYLKGATAVASRYTKRTMLERPSSNDVEYYTVENVDVGGYQTLGFSFGVPTKLYLRNRFNTVVASVINDYDQTGGDETIASGDYTVFADEGVIRFNKDNISSGFKNVKVTYKAGYDTSDWDTDAVTTTFNDVPEDLEIAVLMIAAKMFLDSKKGDDRQGLASKSRDGESISFSAIFEKGLPSISLMILDNYCHNPV